EKSLKHGGYAMRNSGRIPLTLSIVLFVTMAFSGRYPLEAAGESIIETGTAYSTLTAGGESSGPMVLNPTDTLSMAGDPAEFLSLVTQSLLSPKGFATDIRIRSLNASSRETNQAIACDQFGYYYVAWEDDFLGLHYIQVYWSKDGGLSWVPYGALYNSNASLSEPSLTVAHGVADRLLLAYIRDDGTNPPVPEVAASALWGGAFIVHSVPVYPTWEGYRKPVIWTDYLRYNQWYAFLTCESVVNSAVNNVNISAYRSTDWSATWDKNLTVFGNTDSDEWSDPDGAFGTTLNRNFLVCYNKTNKFLYWARSDDLGISYQTMWLHNMTESGLPTNQVDPEIEAASYNDNVVICATRTNDYADTIGCSLSVTAGDTFSSLFAMFTDNTVSRFAVALHAHHYGDSFHLAYTSSNKVYHCSRPQDFSASWSVPARVDDAGYASNAYSKKGIASNWLTDVPGIVWADFRDGSTADYDTYIDTTIKRSLEADKATLSAAAGGTVKFHLDAGSNHGNRNFLILIGATGNFPGTGLPGGLVLPLHWDPLTDLGLTLLNSPVLSNFLGKLDTMGRAMAYLTLPPIPGSEGVILCFAYTLNNPFNFVSNPWIIDILP
ncbi:MAG: hypothetical protein ABIK28_22065, partial [Planctomycetota bacterium]